MKARPNFIFILTDQMRGDCWGADGNEKIETPNLDYLVDRGTRFTHAYSPVPSCIPARASIMTGMNQWHTGKLGMGNGQGEIRNDYPHTLAGELTKSGYRTHLVGKGHFFPQRENMGFQTHELDESGRVKTIGFKSDYRQWFKDSTGNGLSPDDHGIYWNSCLSRPWHLDEYLHPTAWTMTRSIEFLKNTNRAEPFFLNISFARPHSPYVPPAYYFDKYRQSGVPAPFIGDWVDEAAARNMPGPETWRSCLSASLVQQARAGYYGEISFIDTQIGRLINWFLDNDRQCWENTHLIFTSDHGDMLGDHHYWRKCLPYEGSARIPLFIAPANNADLTLRNTDDSPVALMDILPTVLDLAGIEIPESVDGKSLLPLLERPDPAFRQYLHGEHNALYSQTQENQFITDGKAKYIWFPRTCEEQYFDLEKDPGELRNRIGDPEYQEQTDRFKKNLIEEFECRNCGWVKKGAFVKPIPPGPLFSPYRDGEPAGQ